MGLGKKIKKKVGSASKKVKKIGEKTAVNLGTGLSNVGIAVTQTGKVLDDDRVASGIGEIVGTVTGDQSKGIIAEDMSHNLGETMITSGRTAKHGGRSLRQVGRGHGNKAYKQGEKTLRKGEKIDLEKAALVGAEATILFG
mgnify:CR=1 FL=1|tara:strand:- start:368 stop:790 length:423 start_codon:yes stop_codon:yes gene_type:complete